MTDDTTRQQIRDDLAALDQVVQRLRKEEAAAENELATLRQQYPRVLLDEALGRIGPERKTAMRARIATLEADLADFPKTHEQLEAERLRLNARLREVERLENLRNRYESTKERLLEDFGLADVDELRSLARALGCQADAEQFLASITPETAA